MTKEKRDPIEELNEWQEHQYNPGYWVNRFSPEFPPKKSLGFWLIDLFQFLFFGFWFIIVVIVMILDDPKYFPLLIILGVGEVYLALRLIRLKPDRKQRTQEEWDEIRRKQNKERKRDLPKRNKNYK